MYTPNCTYLRSCPLRNPEGALGAFIAGQQHVGVSGDCVTPIFHRPDFISEIAKSLGLRSRSVETIQLVCVTL